MWNLKSNYRKEEEQVFCRLCEAQDDAKEHVLQYRRYGSKYSGMDRVKFVEDSL